MKTLIAAAVIGWLAISAIERIELPQTAHIDTTMQRVDCMVDAKFCNKAENDNGE